MGRDLRSRFATALDLARASLADLAAAIDRTPRLLAMYHSGERRVTPTAARAFAAQLRERAVRLERAAADLERAAKKEGGVMASIDKRKGYAGTQEYLRVYAELIAAAELRGTMIYTRVAKIMGLPHTGNYMSRKVGEMLGEISREEFHNGRPMLSAVAVSGARKKGPRLPGPGFYGCAHDLGLIPTPAENPEFWAAERDRVYDVWESW
jgi:hypothetical protein